MREPSGRLGRGATINDVAAAAGVSIRTVSRVLNRSPRVQDSTRATVEQAIATLDFLPSPQARSLVTGRSHLVGIVHNDRNALVVDSVLRGVVAEASLRTYDLVVHPTRSGSEGSVEEVIAFARRSRVDGVIVLPPVSGIAGMAAALAKAGIPAVALSARPLAGFGSLILSQEREGAAEVARHLLALGHREIALINGPLAMLSASERRAGFVAALAQAGIEPLAEIEGNYDFETGHAAAEALLGGARRPTAIFAVNDIMAAAVLKSAAEKGIAIPGDLSVVGFDHSMIAHMLTPALTTVDRPIAEMAKRATRHLFGILEGQPVDLETTFALRLVEGGTTAPPPVRTFAVRS